MTKKPTAPAGPPSDDETREALEKSGYPLEVKLFKRLQDRGFDPTIGHRFTVGDGSSEVDLVARRRTEPHSYTNEDGTRRTATASMVALMEVKNLPANTRMVGVRSTETPSPRAMRALRGKMLGIPAWHTHREVPDPRNQLTDLLAPDEGLGAAFDVIGGPLCVHWAKVYFKKEGSNHVPWACGDDRWREQVDRLVRVSEMMMRDHTERELEFQATRQNGLLGMTFHTLVLVIQTPHGLGLYDAETRSFSNHDWLTYRRVFDVGAGELSTRVVEIVTSDAGFTMLLDAMERAADVLDEGLANHLPILTEAADAQLAWWRAHSLQEEAHELDPGGIFR